jgi:excisionase family DNA binding protein
MIQNEGAVDELPSVFTVREVATLLRVDPSVITRLLQRRVLHGFRAGRLWRIPRNALLQMLGLQQEEARWLSEPLLTTEEVARALRVTPEAVSLWARRGKVRGVRVGALWRIPASELRALMGTTEESEE